MDCHQFSEGRKCEDEEERKTAYPQVQSVLDVHPPAVLYQTKSNGGKQESAHPGELSIRLSPNAKKAVMKPGALRSRVHVAMRRYDGRELEVYLDGEMVGLRIPQRTYELVLEGDLLHVRVHRKELPVSKTFGNAPFVFCVYIDGASYPELLVSECFRVQSKQPKTTAAAKPPPKRVRPPPPCRPFPAVATGCEAIVNAMMEARATSRAGASAVVDGGSGAGAGSSPTPPPLCVPTSVPTKPQPCSLASAEAPSGPTPLPLPLSTECKPPLHFLRHKRRAGSRCTPSEESSDCWKSTICKKKLRLDEPPSPTPFLTVVPDVSAALAVESRGDLDSFLGSGLDVGDMDDPTRLGESWLSFDAMLDATCTL